MAFIEYVDNSLPPLRAGPLSQTDIGLLHDNDAFFFSPVCADTIVTKAKEYKPSKARQNKASY